MDDGRFNGVDGDHVVSRFIDKLTLAPLRSPVELGTANLM